MTQSQVDDRLLPQFGLLEQPIIRSPLTSAAITAAITAGIDGLGVKPGQRIAVAIGSRGIDKIVDVTRLIVKRLHELGATVFVFPAMGSHGGGTGPGQEKVLAALGVTEASVGCPILSSMDTVQVATAPNGIPVHLDANAAAADGVIVVNRIKPHTHFRGPTESGLNKMLVIGAGKHTQALLMHAHGVAGLRDLVPICAEALIKTGRILAGVGLVEDGMHQLSQLAVVPAEKISVEEPKLLIEARRLMPRLPVNDLDLLIVDQMGKDISGTGMDTNILGRVRALDFNSFDSPFIRVVYVRSLTPATGGNAIGVGLADLVHQDLVDAIDPEKTAINALTGGSPQTAAVPITASCDRDAIELFSRYLKGERETVDLRCIRIKDTLSLDRILISPAVAHTLGEPVRAFSALSLDSRGNFAHSTADGGARP